MKHHPVEVVRRFLHGQPSKTALSSMVAKNATFIAPDGVVTLSEADRANANGHAELLDSAVALLHCSASRRVTVMSMFGAGGNVAAFGTVTEVGNSGEDITLPFSLWVKVVNGRIAHMQYLDGGALSETAPASFQ
jgi:hypothetical protein